MSKRPVLRLLNAGGEVFAAAARAVLGAGLATARWRPVDATGARHRARNGVTTRRGDDRFTFFATGCATSRRHFLELPRAARGDDVVNAAALASLRAHPEAPGLTRLAATPDPVTLATEAALRGSVRAHGRLRDTVLPGFDPGTGDEAGPFRIGRHALCRVPTERLVPKLIRRHDRQRRAVDLVRQLIRWFHAALKADERDPGPGRKAALRAHFERMFRRTTGFSALDRPLARLHARRAELLLVLARPGIALPTNGAETDLGGQVIERKICGGTPSEAGRRARGTLLGLNDDLPQARRGAHGFTIRFTFPVRSSPEVIFTSARATARSRSVALSRWAASSTSAAT